jgi:hypothetical protein
MPVLGDGAQAFGSATTYGRRYGTTGMLGIVTEDDDDAQGADSTPKAEPRKARQPKPEPSGSPEPIASATQLAALRDMAAQAGLDLDVFDDTVKRASDDQGRLTGSRFMLIESHVKDRLAAVAAE